MTKPKTAEQLAEAAVKRLSKELSLVTREQAESLFPEMQEDRINALEAEIKLRKQD